MAGPGALTATVLLSGQAAFRPLHLARHCSDRGAVLRRILGCLAHRARPRHDRQCAAIEAPGRAARGARRAICHRRTAGGPRGIAGQVVSETLSNVQRLVALGNVRISDHGYDEWPMMIFWPARCSMAFGRPAWSKITPRLQKGLPFWSCRRMRLLDRSTFLWGIPRGRMEPAVVITAYRPDPARWTVDFMNRKEP